MWVWLNTAKDRKGPTKDPQRTAKEHYTGPQRIGNHERTARLVTILFNLKKIILFIFVNFGVLMNYGGLWNDHFETPAQINQSFCFLFCAVSTCRGRLPSFFPASGFWTVQDGQAAISRCWLLRAMQQRLRMPTRTQRAGRAAAAALTAPSSWVSLKDNGPTGQTTGQRGSDLSAYRVSITGYYNIL